MSQVAVGDPAAPDTALGPLISDVQRDRVRGYIEAGLAEGARLVTGGPGAPDGLDVGYYVRPTVFSDVTPDMRIAREEIFGPVLVILPYDDEDDAVRRRQRLRLRPRRRRLVGVAGAGDAGGPAAADRPGGDQRRRRSTRSRRSAGSRQSATAASSGVFGIEEFLTVKSLQL